MIKNNDSDFVKIALGGTFVENINNISKAIEYIENHLYEKITLDSLAQAMNYSKHHLHRLFKETVGIITTMFNAAS